VVFLGCIAQIEAVMQRCKFLTMSDFVFCSFQVSAISSGTAGFPGVRQLATAALVSQPLVVGNHHDEWEPN
jgi:hypothetical protein